MIAWMTTVSNRSHPFDTREDQIFQKFLGNVFDTPGLRYCRRV